MEELIKLWLEYKQLSRDDAYTFDEFMNWVIKYYNEEEK
jgi:hypothetical protein